MNRDPGPLLHALLGDRAACDRLIATGLIDQALTHRSLGPVNNERLEFLGDALLGLVIAEALSERFPEADEGELSRRRASLVNKRHLAGLARELALGDYLRMGPGESRTGGHTRDSILSDTLEAVIGAVYLALDFDRARAMLLRLFDASLEASGDLSALKDPKTRLQEVLQSRHRPLPIYELIETSGEAHAQRFKVRCHLADTDLEAIGEGSNRRAAEQAAADQLLASLEG